MELPTLAYIDPGTGSLIIQALIAGLLGMLFAIRKWLHSGFLRLRGFFAGKHDDAGDE
ncbi:MAG: hypothetical protein IH600_12730 [Bacteroidetes bacterium]|nr:hypothetical protein [Bacteroidota bacterium]